MKAGKFRLLGLAAVLAVLISAVPAGSGPMAAVGDVIYNGGFESGFAASACGGMVGIGWGCFNNGGTAAYGFYDDMWAPVVYAGKHSQLVEINTKQQGGDANRNAGIYQKVSVWPNTPYTLSLQGMIRADDHGGDPWRYRVYVGFDYNGGNNWQAVNDWRELPWDKYYPRQSPGSFSSYSTTVTPTGQQLTVFVRLQRKWGDWYEETDLNVDAISLMGPVGKPMPVHPPVDPGYGVHPPADPHHGMHPPVDPGYGMHPPVDPGYSVPPPVASTPPVQPTPAVVCDGPNVLANGGFEYGFQANGVGNYWVGFNNGGHANYGFYDEMWSPVVSEGKHGQLIEINTLNVGSATEPNRVAGIYQSLWLAPGATYEISFSAMMRERGVHADEDFYRYMVEWGYSTGGGTNVDALSYRNRVPLTTIYERTAPGAMQAFSARFVAPSYWTTVYIFALKKWATLERELDVNLDNVVVRQCRQVTPVTPPPPPPHKPPKPQWCTAPGDVVYVVQRGDTLSALAWRYNTSVPAILAKNNIANPNMIYVGQVLCIPDPPRTTAWSPTSDAQAATPEAAPAAALAQEAPVAAASAPAPAPSQASAVTEYRIQRGDTLSKVAARFGTTVEALAALNGISNPNWIYAGQRLVIASN